MTNHGAQKFVGRNRPSRVVIDCDEAIDTGRIKVSIPFVAGVLADLTGHRPEDEEVPTEHADARGDFDERKFINIDAKTFNTVMETMAPRVSFNVQDALTGEAGKTTPIDLTFKSMDDFSPAKIAERVGPIRELLEQRRALANLKKKAINRKEIAKALAKLGPNSPLAKELMDVLDGAAAQGE